MTRFSTQRIRDCFRGCLLGGALGDALGAPVEFMLDTDIRQSFGPDGIMDLASAYGRVGAVTDETQMALFTAEGLLGPYATEQRHDPGAAQQILAAAYLRWLRTQGFSHSLQQQAIQGWLLDHAALHSRRAPSKTCVDALSDLANLNDHARNDSKDCGGVMRVAPVGIFARALNYRTPRSCYRRHAFEWACDAVLITHGHITGQLAAGAFSLMVYRVLCGCSIARAAKDALADLGEYPGHEETTLAIHTALKLAKSSVTVSAGIRCMGEGWVADEALAIGVFCALRAKDFVSGVRAAVNHDGDSDATGLVAGSLLGALLGVQALPQDWLAQLELRDVIETMADDLSLQCYADTPEGKTTEYVERRARYGLEPSLSVPTPACIADIEALSSLFDY